jgi:hypothetical protein
MGENNAKAIVIYKKTFKSSVYGSSCMSADGIWKFVVRVCNCVCASVYTTITVILRLKKSHTISKIVVQSRPVKYVLLFVCSFLIGSSFSCAGIYRPNFRENKPKTLVFSHNERFGLVFALWLYKFGHCCVPKLPPSVQQPEDFARPPQL